MAASPRRLCRDTLTKQDATLDASAIIERLATAPPAAVGKPAQLLAVFASLRRLDADRLAPHAAQLARVLQTSADAGIRQVVVVSLGRLEPNVLAVHAHALVHALSDTDVAVRRYALRALAKVDTSGLTAHAPAVITSLDDPDVATRRVAATILGEMGTIALAPALDHASAGARQAAVRAAGRLPTARFRAHAGACVSLLADADADVREAAAEVLLRVLGRSDGAALAGHAPAILQRLECTPRTAALRRATVRMLGALDAAALVQHAAPIAALLEHADTVVRRAAVELLATAQLPAAVPAVIARLASAEQAPRQAAAAVLARMAPPLVSRHAEAIVPNLGHADGGVRRAAAAALKSMDEAALARLAADWLARLAHDDAAVRAAAAAALARLPPLMLCTHAAAVLPALESRDPAVKRAAASAVRRMEGERRAHTAHAPLLLRALADADPLVRTAVSEALPRVDAAALSAHARLLLPHLAHADQPARRAAAAALAAIAPAALAAHTAALVARLEHPDAAVRTAVVAALGRAEGAAGAAPVASAAASAAKEAALVARLDDMSPAVRLGAAEAVGRLGGDALRRCERALAARLASTSTAVRWAAAMALNTALGAVLAAPAADGDGGASARSGGDGDGIGDDEGGGSDSSGDGRTAVVEAVAVHASALACGCDDGDAALRLVALETLGKLHAAASCTRVPPPPRGDLSALALAHLGDTDANVRCAALRALCRMPRDEGGCAAGGDEGGDAAGAVPPALLLRLLDDPDVRVRKAALAALAFDGAAAVERCAPAIVARLGGGGDAALQQAALHALGAASDATLAKHARPIAARLDDASAEVRVGALQLLRRLLAEGCSPPVLRRRLLPLVARALSADANVRVRRTALAALSPLPAATLAQVLPSLRPWSAPLRDGLSTDGIATRVLSALALGVLDLSGVGLEALPPAALAPLARCLRELNVQHNALSALPDDVGALHALEALRVDGNALTALPACVGALPRLRVLRAADNPLQMPPLGVVERGVTAVRRYFAALARAGGGLCRAAKLVLVGDGEAGKTSFLRGIRRGTASPAPADERTVHLELSELALGDGPARVRLSCWDLGGQPAYAAGTQPYLCDSALFVLIVPAHRANDAHWDAVGGRWLHYLQCRAPGALVQVVLSHADRLMPRGAALAPDALAAAAAPALSWLRARLEQHQRERRQQLLQHAAAAAAAADGADGSSSASLVPPQLRVSQHIPCVCAVAGGDASLLAARAHLTALLATTPPPLPCIGVTVPRSWLPAMALVHAVRDGAPLLEAARAALEVVDAPGDGAGQHYDAPDDDDDEDDDEEQDVGGEIGDAVSDEGGGSGSDADADADAAAIATGGVSAAGDGARPRACVPLRELHTLWEGVCQRLGEARSAEVLDDALALLCAQGDVFVSCGVAYLHPAFVTSLLARLLDHRLGNSRPAARRLLRGYVRATERRAAQRARPPSRQRGVSSASLDSAAASAGAVEGGGDDSWLLEEGADAEVDGSWLSGWSPHDGSEGGSAPWLGHESSEGGSSAGWLGLGSEDGGERGAATSDAQSPVDMAAAGVTAELARSLEEAVVRLAADGELCEELLPFLWRGLGLGRAGVRRDAVVRMLCESGLLFGGRQEEQHEAPQGRRRWVVPLRLPAAPPADLHAAWPPQLAAGEALLRVNYSFWDAMVPPGIVERLMGGLQAVGEYRRYWREGALVVSHSGGGGSLRVLLQLRQGCAVAGAETEARLVVEVRGGSGGGSDDTGGDGGGGGGSGGGEGNSGGDSSVGAASGDRATLARLRTVQRAVCATVDAVLADFPGLLCSPQLACPRCVRAAREPAHEWPLRAVAAEDAPWCPSCASCVDLSGRRELLVLACSPASFPLPASAAEADEVARVASRHGLVEVRHGGSAAELRAQLLAVPTRRFLFTGHANAPWGEGGGLTKTLGFTRAGGMLEAVEPAAVASLLGLVAAGRGGPLEFVFLNGCCSEPLGEAVRAAGVPTVVCWRSEVEDGAARILARAFFQALGSSGSADADAVRAAFESAKAAVRLVTRSGRLAGGIVASVPKYELRAPGVPSTQPVHPPPIAAGVPVLLVTSTPPSP